MSASTIANQCEAVTDELPPLAEDYLQKELRESSAEMAGAMESLIKKLERVVLAYVQSHNALLPSSTIQSLTARDRVYQAHANTEQRYLIAKVLTQLKNSPSIELTEQELIVAQVLSDYSTTNTDSYYDLPSYFVHGQGDDALPIKYPALSEAGIDYRQFHKILCKLGFSNQNAATLTKSIYGCRSPIRLGSHFVSIYNEFLAEVTDVLAPVEVEILKAVLKALQAATLNTIDEEDWLLEFTGQVRNQLTEQYVAANIGHFNAIVDRVRRPGHLSLQYYNRWIRSSDCFSNLWSQALSWAIVFAIMEHERLNPTLPPAPDQMAACNGEG